MAKTSVVQIVAIVFAAGCGASGAVTGDGGIVPGHASCTQTQMVTSGGQTLSMKVCQEWMGMTVQELEVYRQGCGEATAVDAGFLQQRVFAQSPCSRQDALGGCRQTVAGVTQTAWYYADDSGFTLASVQSLCTQLGGTFVEP